MVREILVSCLVIGLSSSVASASTAASDFSSLQRDPYFKLKKPRIKLIEEKESVSEKELNDWLSESNQPPVSRGGNGPGDWIGGLNETAVIIDQIIAIGKKIYAIIEAGRPVVNIQTDRTSALPQGSRHWTQFEGWSNPTSATYEVSYENGFGMDVVKLKFRILYTSNGKLDGKGRFLANVTVLPMDTYVGWGYTLNASTEIPEVVNVGTRTNPIAGMELNVKWEVSTVVRNSRDSASFFIRGDGRILDLTN